MLTREEGRVLAGYIRDGLPVRLRQRLKAIHIQARLHEGHCTARIFTVPDTADDPESYVYAAHEI